MDKETSEKTVDTVKKTVDTVPEKVPNKFQIFCGKAKDFVKKNKTDIILAATALGCVGLLIGLGKMSDNDDSSDDETSDADTTTAEA